MLMIMMIMMMGVIIEIGAKFEDKIIIDQFFFDRGRVSWLRLAPRTDHWKKRLPPSLNQWLQPPGAESLSEFTSLGDLSLINSDSSDSRHPCGDFSGGSDPLLVISAPEDLGKSVIRKNFEEILKTCFDDTQFCDFL